MKKTVTTMRCACSRAIHATRWALLLLLFLLLGQPGARGQTWQSVITAGHNANGYSEVDVSAVDATGNVYLTGIFYGSVRFGTILLTGVGSNDMYVAKYNTLTQTFVWAIQATSIQNAEITPRGLAVSGSTIYVGGSFEGFATFGSTTLVCNGYNDVFVARIIDQGTSAAFSWAQRVGGSDSEYLTGLVASGNNVYLAGSIISPAVSFGATTLGNTGNGTGFVAKLTDTGTAGNFVWALPITTAASADGTYVKQLALSGTAVYLTGQFTGTATFGNTVLVSRGGDDAFIAKVVDAGAGTSFGWVQQVGGMYSDVGSAIAVSGNTVYASGYYNSATLTIGAATLVYSGNLYYHNLYATKLVDNGSSASFAWATQAGATNTRTEPHAMLASNGSLYLVGDYLGGSPSFGATALPAGSTTTRTQTFATRLVDAGSSGSFAWAQYGSDDSAGAYNSATGVHVVATRLLVTGSLRPMVSFGTNSIPNGVATSIATFYAFMAFLTDPALAATTATHDALVLDAYPNPAHARATVQLPPVSGAATATLTLLDALGRTLRTATVALPPAGLRHELDLSGLPAGLYAVRVAAGSSTATQRLTVE